MNCPFLRDAHVRSCAAAPVRKLLMQTAPAAEERCSTPEYVRCPVYRDHLAASPVGNAEQCPFLHESGVQYCAAAALPVFVPSSETTVTACGAASFRYCDVYLQRAHQVSTGGPAVDGIPFPDHLRYTPNHMWIDLGEDGSWRIGVDGLFAHAIGSVDAVAYLTRPPGRTRPSAVISTRGADLHLTFPRVVPLAACNHHLHAYSDRIVSAPYGAGWLFGGNVPPDDIGQLLS